MPAVATQQLATIADLDTGPATAAMVQALAMFDAATKNAYLRRASGVVLSAYGIRFGRVLGASFTLATWGDLTIGFVVSIARWLMLSDRGFNGASPTDKAIRDRYDETIKILDEISDIQNRTPRIDPDASDGTPATEELGALSCSEGGPLDEADAWAKPLGFLPGGSGLFP